MNRLTKGLGIIGLVEAVGLGSLMYFGRDITPPAPTSGQYAAAQDEIKRLEDEVDKLKFNRLLDVSSDPEYKSWLEDENSKLEEENQKLRNKKAELERKVGNNLVEINELNGQKSRLWHELEGVYKNTRVNDNYPLSGFEDLLKSKEIGYNSVKLRQAWEGKDKKGMTTMSEEDREGFYLAFGGPETFFNGFSPAKQQRYERFYRSGLSREEKRQIESNLGFIGLDDYKSSFSLAVFQGFENERKRAKK
jgi:hypothetical protein